MTTFGEFASLLQLGVGTGIGLSLFQAPIDLRFNLLSRRVDDDIILTEASAVPSVKERNLSLKTLKIRLASTRIALEKRQTWPLGGAILGAAMNLALLIWCSILPDFKLHEGHIAGLIFVSVIWFFGILAWMDLLALDELSPLINDHKKLSR